MAKIYTAQEWADKRKIDLVKVEEERKAKSVAEKKKRTDAAKKQPGYMAPSNSIDKG